MGWLWKPRQMRRVGCRGAVPLRCSEKTGKTKRPQQVGGRPTFSHPRRRAGAQGQAPAGGVAGVPLGSGPTLWVSTPWRSLGS